MEIRSGTFIDKKILDSARLEPVASRLKPSALPNWFTSLGSQLLSFSFSRPGQGSKRSRMFPPFRSFELEHLNQLQIFLLFSIDKTICGSKKSLEPREPLSSDCFVLSRLLSHTLYFSSKCSWSVLAKKNSLMNEFKGASSPFSLSLSHPLSHAHK